jgi:hypothetical protein
MTAPVPLDETSKKAIARVAVPHMSRYMRDFCASAISLVQPERMHAAADQPVSEYCVARRAPQAVGAGNPAFPESVPAPGRLSLRSTNCVSSFRWPTYESLLS